MSVAVGAALKKIAVALVTNPKTLKYVVGIIIGTILLIIFPIIILVSMFSGSIKIDEEELANITYQNLSQVQKDEFALMNDTMTKINKELDKKKMSSSKLQAEVIYFFYLSDKSSDKTFVDDYVSCFKKDISNTDLVKAVNKKFSIEINIEEFNNIMKMVSDTSIDVSNYVDADIKNNLDLVKWCEDALRKNWGYVYGGYGQVCTVEFLDQQAKILPGDNEAGGPMRELGDQWIGKRVADCIGLIKSYAWYDYKTDTITVNSNGFIDCGATSIWNYVTTSGDISSMPEVKGLAVWKEGHIGVYIGDGKVIEAKGTAYGVVETKVENGNWKKWLEVPHIKYIEESENEKD